MFETALTFILRACLLPGGEAAALLAGMAGALALAIYGERLAARL